MDANGREYRDNLALIDRGYQGYLMNGDYPLEKELVYKLTGAVMAVLNELGHRVIIETKTVESITDEQRGQVLNYLKITSLPVGVIFNFKRPKLQWERIVLEKNH